MHSVPSCRCLVTSVLIAAGIAILTGCGGLASSGSPPANAGSVLAAKVSTLSFGNVPKSKSSELSETVTNTGTSAVTISEADISGSGFSLTGLNVPTSLSPNESLTFSVTFTPSSAGSSSGTLSLVSTAKNSTLNIALSGAEMAAGQLSLSSSSLSFGNVLVGGEKSMTATLEATGSSVTVSAASSNSSEFVLSGISLPLTLAAGETSPSFTVTFTPATSGTASATISFGSNGADSPTALALTGTGTAAEQHSVDLTWSPSDGDGVVGYNVYRGSVAGGPYSKINPALEASTTFTDDNVSAGATFYYVTTAVTGSGDESAYSNQTKAVIPAP